MKLGSPAMDENRLKNAQQLAWHVQSKRMVGVGGGSGGQAEGG